MSGEKLTIPQVAARYPGKSGKRLHPASVTRWVLAGCTARDGSRVKLHATRVGSRWIIDESDLELFFARLSAEPGTIPPPQPERTDSRRAKAIAHAVKSLISVGA